MYKVNQSSKTSLLSIFKAISKELQIVAREKQIKYLRQKKANEGCPLNGYCPYDINDPFDCDTCLSK